MKAQDIWCKMDLNHKMVRDNCKVHSLSKQARKKRITKNEETVELQNETVTGNIKVTAYRIK